MQQAALGGSTAANRCCHARRQRRCGRAALRLPPVQSTQQPSPITSTSSSSTSPTWPSVPWQPGRFSIAFTQVICLQLPLAFGSVGLWASLRGLPVDQVTPDELDAVLLASDLVQLAGVLAIVRSSLQADAPRFGARPQASAPQSSLQASSPASNPPTNAGASPPPDHTPGHAPSPAPNSNTPFISSPLTYNFDAQSVALGCASGVAALAGVAALSLLAAGDEPADTTQALPLLQGSTSGGLLLATLSNTVTGPVTEELVWRGLLFPSLAAWLGSVPAALALSSLGFALYHLSGPELPALTLLGLCLGGAMHLSKGNLAAPTIGHAVYNAVALSTAMLSTPQPPGGP